MGGVDVILNALTSPGMVAASISTLRHGGRFVEIAKRGIWSAAATCTSRPDVSFQLVAIDFLSPSAVGQDMLRVSTAAVKGLLCPLPVLEYGMVDVQAAMRIMSQV